MKNKTTILMASVFLLFLITLSGVSALSNESANAQENINKASSCLNELIERNISSERASISLQESTQLYEGQLSLEKRGITGKYGTVKELSLAVCEIKDNALKANDELAVFIETFLEINKTTNLSSIETDYQDVIKSFEDERFEDTLKLINEGYTKISKIQAEQTTIRLFYETTSRTLKNFFINNWLKLSIGTIVTVIFLIIFWKSFKRIRVNTKIRNLEIQKNTLNKLIRQLQIGYFKNKNISEREFTVKLKRFKEMAIDIERKIPLLKEELVKISRNPRAAARRSSSPKTSNPKNKKKPIKTIKPKHKLRKKKIKKPLNKKRGKKHGKKKKRR